MKTKNEPGDRERLLSCSVHGGLPLVPLLEIYVRHSTRINKLRTSDRKTQGAELVNCRLIVCESAAAAACMRESVLTPR